jgi:hypothetical protein
LRHNGHPKAIYHLEMNRSAVDTKRNSDHVGNARAVCDKFHVIKSVKEACE